MHAMSRCFACVVTLVAMPVLADAGPKEQAKMHVAKATKAHGEGKYDVALRELLAAYQLDPQPDLLFAIAQVYAKLDNCAEAIPFYDKFLATTDDPQARPVVTEAIDTCKARLAQAQPEPAASPPPEPVAAPAVPEPAPEPKPEVPAPTPEVRRDEPVAPVVARVDTTARPWYRDSIGDTLVIGGVIAGVVGVVMYGQARSDLDSAETSQTLAGYHDLIDSGHSKRLYSVLFVGGGAALVGAGVAHFLLRDHGGVAGGVGIVPASGGGLVTWSGGF